MDIEVFVDCFVVGVFGQVVEAVTDKRLNCNRTGGPGLKLSATSFGERSHGSRGLLYSYDSAATTARHYGARLGGAPLGSTKLGEGTGGSGGHG